MFSFLAYVGMYDHQFFNSFLMTERLKHLVRSQTVQHLHDTKDECNDKSNCFLGVPNLQGLGENTTFNYKINSTRFDMEAVLQYSIQ